MISGTQAEVLGHRLMVKGRGIVQCRLAAALNYGELGTLVTILILLFFEMIISKKSTSKYPHKLSRKPAKSYVSPAGMTQAVSQSCLGSRQDHGNTRPSTTTEIWLGLGFRVYFQSLQKAMSGPFQTTLVSSG